MGHHNVFLAITNVPAQDQKYFQNLAKSNSELWQVGDTLIWIGGYAFDENSSQPERFREYEIQFVLNGFKYTIIGTNLELLKTSIIANFFPDYSSKDMILISSTVEK